MKLYHVTRLFILKPFISYFFDCFVILCDLAQLFSCQIYITTIISTDDTGHVQIILCISFNLSFHIMPLRLQYAMPTFHFSNPVTTGLKYYLEFTEAINRLLWFPNVYPVLSGKSHNSLACHNYSDTMLE